LRRCSRSGIWASGSGATVRPLRAPREARVLCGRAAPDLIDKPLFYIPFWLAGAPTPESSPARTSSRHTLLFLLALIVAARLARAPAVRAVLGLRAVRARHAEALQDVCNLPEQEIRLVRLLHESG